jgi:hypothetical protein
MKALAAASFLLFTTACTLAGSQEPAMRVVASGSYATTSPSKPESCIAGDAAELEALWKARIGDKSAPEADFSRESVVVLMAGERRTGGWSVNPQSVALEGSTLVVTAPIQGPGAGDMTTQAFTSPWVAIAVSPKAFTSVRWEP